MVAKWPTSDPPYWVLDPVVEVRLPGQVDDLLGEIRDRASKNQRVLVTTLTKRMAEDHRLFGGE